MKMDSIIEDLSLELKELGYVQDLEYVNGNIHSRDQNLCVAPTDLFFIDGAYLLDEKNVILAINSPLFNLKGTMVLGLIEYEHLLKGKRVYSALHLMDYLQGNESIRINRQYGMRKIRAEEFDSNRYVLRENYPDFPSCPYGHTFKELGYDLQEKEYVRLAPSIMRKTELERIKYN